MRDGDWPAGELPASPVVVVRAADMGANPSGTVTDCTESRDRESVTDGTNRLS